MKAVVMAGGEGTRLRPLTANLPKPLLPVANRPIMEHVLRLLRKHGLRETVVTVQFLAQLVRNRFGTGDELGMELAYAHEERPLGTAGSVKNAESALKDDTFLVISGDALTDFDLGELIRFHKDKGALVTVCLTRVPNPLEFGITITDEDGRVERFLEKPTWGQVFSDTVNTGIYVLEPEVLAYIEADTATDWSTDVFPRLLEEGRPIYGYVADGYWEDIGTLESYAKAQADVLDGRVGVTVDGFELSPSVWIGEGADISPDAHLQGPLCIGPNVKVEASATLLPYTVVGANTIICEGAQLHRAVLHEDVYVGPSADLRGSVVGKKTEIMRAARLNEGAVTGESCLIGAEAVIAEQVRIYQSKTIEPGSLVNASLIWEPRAQAQRFGSKGVSGLLNIEVTPEVAVRVASAFATSLNKDAAVTVARDHSRGAQALQLALISALQSSAVHVHHLENVPLPVARHHTGRGGGAGIFVRTTAGVRESVDILLLDEAGGDLTPAAQRKLDRLFARQEYRRAFPGEIGALALPPRVLDTYADSLFSAVDTSGIAESGMKIVVDNANGSAGIVLPAILGRLGIDSLVVNCGLEEAKPTETPQERAEGLEALGRLVASARASLGARFDPVAERLSLVDERGQIIDDHRALLTFVSLLVGEGGLPGPLVLAAPVSRWAEEAAQRGGAHVHRAGIVPAELSAEVQRTRAAWAGDGAGGFIVPAVSPGFDAVAALVQLIGLLARSRDSLSKVEARIPAIHVQERESPTPWSAMGTVMRQAVEEATRRDLTTESVGGIRLTDHDGRWILILPDPDHPTTRLWAEGPTAAATQALLDDWTAVLFT